jgi:hypothetical protein
MLAGSPGATTRSPVGPCRFRCAAGGRRDVRIEATSIAARMSSANSALVRRLCPQCDLPDTLLHNVPGGSRRRLERQPACRGPRVADWPELHYGRIGRHGPGYVQRGDRGKPHWTLGVPHVRQPNLCPPRAPKQSTGNTWSDLNIENPHVALRDKVARRECQAWIAIARSRIRWEMHLSSGMIVLRQRRSGQWPRNPRVQPNADNAPMIAAPLRIA